MQASEHILWDDTRLADPHAQPDKARRVQRMFDGIAPTYERVNRLMSAGRDRAWRRRAVAMSRVSATDCVLDVACGTGDLTRAFLAANPARVVGSDFSAGMLREAARQPGSADYCRADALSLPFADGSFDVAGCAFGVRNFQQLDDGLREFYRVLRSGGRICILEFTMPRSRWMGRLYLFYFRRVLPRVATWISRDRTGAYDYLPQSVSTFTDGPGMTAALRDVGFQRIESASLTAGVAAVYIGTKP